MTATLREGIYPALTLLVVGCTIAVFIRSTQPLRILFPWLIGLGFALSGFWLTREEGVWIMPFILFVIGMVLLRAFNLRPRNWATVFLCGVPFGIWLIFLATVAWMNQINYGVFSTNECKSPDFLAAYGALCRVEHAHWLPTVTLPKETRDRIYKVSPAFAELQPYLEAKMSKKWEAANKKIFLERYEKDPNLRATLNKNLRLYLGKNSSDIWVRMWFDGNWFTGDAVGGDFLWSLRDAVAAAGHYSSGLSASKYYRKLAGEVNAACSDGRLSCGAERATMMPPWKNEYAAPLVKTLFSSIGFLVRFEGFSPHSKPSKGQEEDLAMAREITRDRLFPPEYQNDIRTRFLEGVGKIYEIAIPLLSAVGFLLYIICTVRLFRKRTFAITWIINTGLLIAIISRLFLVSLIHVSSFPAVNPRYLSPAYPLLLVFISMALVHYRTIRESYSQKSPVICVAGE